MNKLEKALLVILISYFIGNFSSAFILGKFVKKVDIREHGSGNAGATNALRVLGKKLGILTFVLDVSKGILAVYIGQKIMGYNGALIGGISAVLGHNWPILLKFKGGKGVATSLGVLASIHWITGLICILIGVIIIYKTKYVSLGAIIASASAPIIAILINRPLNKNFLLVTLILGLLSIFRHRANIDRLLKGNEYKIGQKTSR